MNACSACEAAKHEPRTPKHDSGCRACQVRKVALMTPVRRQIALSRVSPDNRTAFSAEVRVELRRIRVKESGQRAPDERCSGHAGGTER